MNDIIKRIEENRNNPNRGCRLVSCEYWRDSVPCMGVDSIVGLVCCKHLWCPSAECCCCDWLDSDYSYARCASLQARNTDDILGVADFLLEPVDDWAGSWVSDCVVCVKSFNVAPCVSWANSKHLSIYGCSNQMCKMMHDL